MTSLVSHTSTDCRDAYPLSTWWRDALGYRDIPGDPNDPGHEECMIEHPETGHRLLFIEVAESKSGKNRLHLDLRPRVGTQAEELDRFLAAGATQLEDRRGIHGPGTGWVVLADPEGNEFCVLRGPEDPSPQQ